jgi:hypothetical protein
VGCSPIRDEYLVEKRGDEKFLNMRVVKAAGEWSTICRLYTRQDVHLMGVPTFITNHGGCIPGKYHD